MQNNNIILLLSLIGITLYLYLNITDIQTFLSFPSFSYYISNNKNELDIPLKNILDGQLVLLVICLLVLILIIYFLFSLFLLNNIKYRNTISTLVDKVLPTKYKNSFNKLFDNSRDISAKVSYTLLGINLILLFLLLLFNIYVTFELSNNLDDYITVYNYITGNNSKSLILMSFLKNNISLNFNLREFLKSLSTLELFAFISLCFNYLILNALISIIFIFYGDYLIKYFNLEEKYPRIAKLISLRRKLNSYALKYNIFIIILAAGSQLSASIIVL